jgi:hypothetical protein
VGIFVDSPEYGFSGIRQPERKLVSQQPEQAKNNIAALPYPSLFQPDSARSAAPEDLPVQK